MLKKLVLGREFVQELVLGRVIGYALTVDSVRNGDKDEIVQVEGLQ